MPVPYFYLFIQPILFTVFYSIIVSPKISELVSEYETLYSLSIVYRIEISLHTLKRMRKKLYKIKTKNRLHLSDHRIMKFQRPESTGKTSVAWKTWIATRIMTLIAVEMSRYWLLGMRRKNASSYKKQLLCINESL